uniref:Uncharacterized protein n=1 Tax=Anguilla anguilla TaxID=7936 RepID=A0A0E9SIG7_ANGAN
MMAEAAGCFNSPPGGGSSAPHNGFSDSLNLPPTPGDLNKFSPHYLV